MWNIHGLSTTRRRRRKRASLMNTSQFGISSFTSLYSSRPQIVVFEFGSRFTRIGFRGDELPRFVVDSPLVLFGPKPMGQVRFVMVVVDVVVILFFIIIIFFIIIFFSSLIFRVRSPFSLLNPWMFFFFFFGIVKRLFSTGQFSFRYMISSLFSSWCCTWNGHVCV